MPSITIDRETSMRVLNNPEADSDSQLIAACVVVFFIAKDTEDSTSQATRTITQKLLRAAAYTIDGETAP